MVLRVPFAYRTWLTEPSTKLRVGAGVLVICFGLWRLFDGRHPRILARIKPSQLALWSHPVAIAHGAGLLLVPVYLGMVGYGDHTSHAGMDHSMQSHIGMAIIVAVAHSLAMVAGGDAIAWLVYRYLSPAVSQEKLVQPASPVGCQPHCRRHGRYLVGDFKSLRPAVVRCSGHDKSLPMLGSQALRGEV